MFVRRLYIFAFFFKVDFPALKFFDKDWMHGARKFLVTVPCGDGRHAFGLKDGMIYDSMRPAAVELDIETFYGL